MSGTDRQDRRTTGAALARTNRLGVARKTIEPEARNVIERSLGKGYAYGMMGLVGRTDPIELAPSLYTLKIGMSIAVSKLFASSFACLFDMFWPIHANKWSTGMTYEVHTVFRLVLLQIAASRRQIQNPS